MAQDTYVQIDPKRIEELSERLQPLTAQDGAWRFSALEAQAYLALRAGDKSKAETILTGLSQDVRAPRSLASRASDVLRTLN